MGERLTYDQLNEIKKELNVFDIYSFSKVNLFKTDPYGYYLRYIMKIKEDSGDSIYAMAGSLVHDLTEKFQADEITREEMLSEYNEKSFEMEQLGFKFDRTDENKNENISKKYHMCNTHFIEHYQKIEGIDGVSENAVTIKVGNFVFVGYVDYQHVEDINEEKYLIVTDFKTSTIYKGDKVNKEKMQLLLYSLGYIQQGWDINKVKARWCFTKYVTVEVKEKKGTWKIRQIERNEIGSKLSASAKMWLKDTKRYTDEEIEDMLVEMLVDNSIDMLPEDVKDNFKMSDCYVYIDITQEEIDELVNDFIDTIHSMKIKEGEYLRTKDDSVFWTEIDKKNEYFFSVLSGYSPKLHKPFAQYLKQKEVDKKPFEFSVGDKTNLENDSDDIDILALLEELDD